MFYYDNYNYWSVDSNINYNTICQSLPVGVLVTSIHDNLEIKLVNRVFLKMLGYESMEEYRSSVGKSILSAIHPDDIESFKEYVAQINCNRHYEKDIIRFRTIDYNYVSVRLFVSTCEADSFTFVCTDCSVHTEYSRSIEEKYYKTNDELRRCNLILNNIPGGFHRCQLFEPIHVEYISDGLCKMSGYSKSDISDGMKGKYTCLIHPDDREYFEEAIYQLAEYPHLRKLEYRIVCKDGRIIPVVDVIQSVRQEDGQMWAYAIVIEGEHNYMMHYHDYEYLTDNMPAGLIVLNYENNNASVIYVNKSYSEITGYTDLLEDNNVELGSLFMIHEDDKHIVFNQIRLFHNGSDSFDCTFRINVGNEIITIHAVASVERKSNEKSMIYIFVQEIPVINTDYNLTGCIKDSKKPSIRINTFGYFEVFVNDNPIYFRSEKARELLAILVDRRGGFATQGEIISKLWENETANKATLARCRKTYKTLFDELKSYGIEYILESNNGTRRIIPETVSCDLFNYRSGKPQYRHLFNGSYMLEYSWAETTLYDLISQKESNS